MAVLLTFVTTKNGAPYCFRSLIAKDSKHYLIEAARETRVSGGVDIPSGRGRLRVRLARWQGLSSQFPILHRCRARTRFGLALRLRVRSSRPCDSSSIFCKGRRADNRGIGVDFRE